MLQPASVKQPKVKEVQAKEAVEIAIHPVWEPCLKNLDLESEIISCLQKAKPIYEGGEIFIIQIKDESDAADQLSQSSGMQETLRKALADALRLPKLKLHLLAEKKKKVVEAQDTNDDVTQNPVVQSMVEIFKAQVINVRSRA